MKIGVVSPLVRVGPEGLVGYGGIERAAYWLATELASRGHEVVFAGNVDEGPSKAGWTGLKLDTENDVFTPEKLNRLLALDAISDWTHMKALRMSRAKGYLATVMWTDQRDEARRNVYPSKAVQEAFKPPDGTVVPIGLPTDGIRVSEGNGRYVCLGRLAPYKGQDLAISVARAVGVDLLVAGHTGAFADPYFAMAIKRRCEIEEVGFVPDPVDLEAFLDGAEGLIHTHRWLESFSIVAAQALLRGVPVLTTDTGAVREWVTACDGGTVVPLKDLEAGKWDTASSFFETNWKSRRPGIAKRAREIFDVRNVAGRYLELFGEK